MITLQCGQRERIAENRYAINNNIKYPTLMMRRCLLAHDWDCLLLCDRFQLYYLCGISNCTYIAYDEFAEVMREHIMHKTYARVILFGMCMGAYAALLFVTRCGLDDLIDEVHAYSPVIDPVNENTWADTYREYSVARAKLKSVLAMTAYTFDANLRNDIDDWATRTKQNKCRVMIYTHVACDADNYHVRDISFDETIRVPRDAALDYSCITQSLTHVMIDIDIPDPHVSVKFYKQRIDSM